MKTTVRTILLALVLAGAPTAVTAQAANEVARPGEGAVSWHPAARAAIDQLKSPYCPGLMLEVCPSAGGAALRDSLQQLALEGRSTEQIVDWVLANHGEEWRALPERSGMSLVLAWLVPPFGVLVGLGLVIVALRRMRAAQRDIDELLTHVGEFLKGAADFIIANLEADMHDEEVRDLIRKSDVIGTRADEVRDAHLLRVKEGRCDALAGLVFSDIIVALRRIKNHSVNLLDARIGRWEERREALRNLERNADESTRVEAVS